MWIATCVAQFGPIPRHSMANNFSIFQPSLFFSVNYQKPTNYFHNPFGFLKIQAILEIVGQG